MRLNMTCQYAADFLRVHKWRHTELFVNSRIAERSWFFWICWVNPPFGARSQTTPTPFSKWCGIPTQEFSGRCWCGQLHASFVPCLSVGSREKRENQTLLTALDKFGSQPVCLSAGQTVGGLSVFLSVSLCQSISQLCQPISLSQSVEFARLLVCISVCLSV